MKHGIQCLSATGAASQTPDQCVSITMECTAGNFLRNIINNLLSIAIFRSIDAILIFCFESYFDMYTNAEFIGCPFEQDTTWNITWPATNINEVATQKCPGGSEAEGFATRRCLENDQWDSPNVSQCRTVEQLRLEMRAEELASLVQNRFVNESRDLTQTFMPEVVENIADELQEITNTTQPLLPNDVSSAANTLDTIISVTLIIVESDELDQALLENVVEDSIGVLDSLLDERNDVSFEQMTDEVIAPVSVSERLLMNTEEIGVLFSRTINDTGNQTIRATNNIVIGAQIATQENLKKVNTVEFPPSDSSTNNNNFMMFGNMTPMIQIPSSVIINQIAEEGASVPVIFIVARNTRLPTDEGERVESFLLSSQISNQIQTRTELGGETALLSFNIDPPGNRTFFNPHCEFFEFSSTADQSGGFSADGIIQLSTTNRTFVQCRSEHLTSFAVLVDATRDTTGSKALSIVSYVGCGISIVCLLFTIVVLIILRKQVFNKVQHFIHLNLSIALLLGLVTFVSGIETASEYRASCLIVAILLHYFFMAAFSWMLCEGILLFVLLSFVFYKGFFKSRKFFMVLGWGLPLPIVIVSVAVSHEQYGINDRCWISEEKGAIWAFIGPMLLIIMVNLFFLSTILYKVFASKQRKLNATEISTLETVKSLIKAAIIVIPLLGVTWVFGLLAINESAVVFAWIFTILNSLQGFFIMFFYVLRNEGFLKKIKQYKMGDSLVSRAHSTLTKGTTFKSGKETLVLRNMDEKTRAKVLTHYNSVICNDYTTPASVHSPERQPPSTIFNTPGIIDDYDFDDTDKIQYTSPHHHHLMRSVSPSISPSQYLKHQREAVFKQANEDAVEDTNF